MAGLEKFAAIENRVKQLHAEAHATAFSIYLRKGDLPPRLAEIMEITSSIKSFIDDTFKFNPDQPRVPAGNPDGGQWTDENGTQTVEDMIYQNPTAFLGGALFSLFGGVLSDLGTLGEAATEGATVLADDAKAVTQRLVDYLAPDGAPIGEAGRNLGLESCQGIQTLLNKCFRI